MNEVMDFSDLTEVAIPVTLPDGTKCLLVEANGEITRQYRNLTINNAIFGVEGKISKLQNVADAESLLVGGCLYKLDANGNRPPKPVGQAFVLTLGNRIVKPLFEKAKDISDLREEEETIEQLQAKIDKLQAKQEAEKKSQESMEVGSA